MPESPNPPTASEAPSGMSATAAEALSTTLSTTTAPSSRATCGRDVQGERPSGCPSATSTRHRRCGDVGGVRSERDDLDRHVGEQGQSPEDVVQLRVVRDVEDAQVREL